MSAKLLLPQQTKSTNMPRHIRSLLNPPLTAEQVQRHLIKPGAGPRHRRDRPDQHPMFSRVTSMGRVWERADDRALWVT